MEPTGAGKWYYAGDREVRETMHIFFATDGSVSARFAQAQILALPWRMPLRITVMMATNDLLPAFRSAIPTIGRAGHAVLVDDLSVAKTEAAEVVARARLAMEKKGASVSTRVHPGPAGPTIVETAKACRADLVAVGSRGLGEYKGFLLGSVSDYVANHAHCSVLLAKTPPKAEHRFLCAVGDAAHAEEVIRWMKELDLASGAWIHQVMVIRTVNNPLRLDGADRRGTGETRLLAWLRSCGNPPDVTEVPDEGRVTPAVVRVTASVRCGQEVPEILAATRDFGPELLVLGAGGRSSPDGLRMGELARKLIHQAPCSVLILRA